MINIKKLFTKAERGTHKGRVQVTRAGKTFTQIRALGKKTSGRAGTGKMDKFPESIKKEILEQRSLSTSGAKIKSLIEGMISHGTQKDPKIEGELQINSDKYAVLFHQQRQESDPNKIKNIETKIKENLKERKDITSKIGDEVSTYINGKPTGRNLVKEGLITESGKLTVTSQALTEWAKKQGVESSKTRVSTVSREKEAHADTKKELDRSNQKIGELKVAASHNLEEIKLIQQSKMESDRIRQELGKDNRSLKEKLAACLKGKNK